MMYLEDLAVKISERLRGHRDELIEYGDSQAEVRR